MSNDKKLNVRTPNSDEKKCPVCGNWFIPDKYHKTYCSGTCRIEGKKEKEKINKRIQRKKNK